MRVEQSERERGREGEREMEGEKEGEREGERGKLIKPLVFESTHLVSP